MAAFTYKATKKDGMTITGHLEAESHEAAVQALAREGLHPLTVKAADKKGGGNSPFGNFGKKVKTNDLVIFTRQLATMVSAGVPLARGLELLRQDPESPYFREVLADVTKEVKKRHVNGRRLRQVPKRVQ